MRYKKNLHLDGYKVYSYNTHVATLNPSAGVIVIHGWWSQTTSMHINHVAAAWGLKKVKGPGPQEETPKNGGGLGMIAGIAKLGEILCDNQKDKNDWKMRMLKAGLENQGLMIPDDWGLLSEDEKQRRLNGAITAIA